MSDTEDTEKRPGRKSLSLKPTRSAGTVRQSFPHGRSSTVAVEIKKKRRTASTKDKPAKTAKPKDDLTPEQKAAKALGLSEDEVKRRQQAIEAAKAEEAERAEKKKAEEAARKDREAEDLARLQTEREREEAEARAREAEAARLAAEAEAEKLQAETRPAAKTGAPSRRDKPAEDERGSLEGELESLGGRVKQKRGGGPGPAKPSPRARGAEPGRRRQKLTISSALEGDSERQRSMTALRRAREKERQRRASGAVEREKIAREVVVPEAITVAELANRMAERSADVVKYLMQQGQMMRAVDVLDADTAELIVEEFGHKIKRVSEADVEEGFLTDDDPEESKKSRPPVVTVMGHVDHGKTSLLDALRSTDVVGGEAGGITQHIGAYQVQTASGDKITFIDTPGHAAFSAMRARGADVTDIVILVVAADDGVMPQTIEAIQHAKAAEAPIIVAVNKIDKPEANSQKVLQDLLQHEVVVESMGGDVQVVEVSALKRIGLDALIEAISLQAELLELKANPDRSAEGVVIESQLEKGRGPVATLLVQRGTLRRGEIVVAGAAWGKARALSNERGQQVNAAEPSAAVELLGLSEPPEPGEAFAVVDSEARARELTSYRDRQRREGSSVAPAATASLEQMMSKLKDKTVSELPIVVKADVQGSAEAIVQAVEKIGNEDVRARAILSGVGGVSESDVLLAKSTGAPILAFNVRANKQARELAEREGVEVRYYSIIYELIDDMRATLEGMLAPEKRENFIGYAEILEVFNISKVGKVAGCRVTEGVVKRGCGVRLIRDDTVLHEGELSTLKRFKDEVAEVKAGTECGMGFVGYHDLQIGDKIECFDVVEVERKLD
ncbi:MAG: translation initiation factor IF-2 [Maricaulaceae bacterium]|jgi:translation initiation factor IF-2